MAKPQDNVIREFPQLNSKYRVRLLSIDNGNQVLDIREYIASDTFQGFTRRGIRLSVPQDTATLANLLAELHAPSAPAPAAKPKKGGRK